MAALRTSAKMQPPSAGRQAFDAPRAARLCSGIYAIPVSHIASLPPKNLIFDLNLVVFATAQVGVISTTPRIKPPTTLRKSGECNGRCSNHSMFGDASPTRLSFIRLAKGGH